jgi:hypothetical protein
MFARRFASHCPTRLRRDDPQEFGVDTSRPKLTISPGDGEVVRKVHCIGRKSDSMQETLAPIGVFAFKRPRHLATALRSLALNPEFVRSPLFIFCDGARKETDRVLVEEVRTVAREFSHPDKHVVEQPRNLGLASSISAGVSRLCESRGTAIVIEDDLTVSPIFLRYMNDALRRYADHEQVMQVVGHVYPPTLRSEHDAVMLPMTSTLGWATWQRAWRHYDAALAGRSRLEQEPDLRRKFNLDGAYPYWEMLQQQLAGGVDSWGIKWYLSVFLRGGLSLFPTQTLVAHEFDGTGTHCATPQSRTQKLRLEPINRWPPATIDPLAYNDMKRYLRWDRSLAVRVARLLGARIQRLSRIVRTSVPGGNT